MNTLNYTEVAVSEHGRIEHQMDAFIGFDSMEEAEHFAAENAGKVVELRKRDGDHYWTDHGRVPGPFTDQDYVNRLTDNHRIVAADDIPDMIPGIVESTSDLDELIDKLTELRVLRDAVEQAWDDETVIAYEGRYDETVKREMMRYWADTVTYEIGVIIK